VVITVAAPRPRRGPEPRATSAGTKSSGSRSSPSIYVPNKVTPDELFRHVVDGAADSLGADEASLMLVEGDDLSRFPNLVPKGGRIQSAVSVPLEVGGRVVLEIPQRRPGA
jgi:hypothetical protein